MNKKRQILTLSCMALLVVAMTTWVYKVKKEHSRCIGNAVNVAIASFEHTEQDYINKRDEVLNAIEDNVESPGQAESMRPHLQTALKIKTIADSLRARIDNCIAVVSRVNTGHIGILPFRIPVDTTCYSIMACQRTFSTHAEELELWCDKFPDDFAHITGWATYYLSPRTTKNAATMNLARLKCMIASIEHHYIGKVFENSCLKCSPSFGNYRIIVVTKTPFLLEGDRGEVTILPASLDWLTDVGASLTSVTVGDRQVPVHGATGTYTYVASTPGLTDHHGTMHIKGLQYDSQLPFKWEELVATPEVRVGYDKELTFKTGEETAIAVTANGFDYSDIDVTLSRGNISGRRGHYFVKIDEPGEVQITVMATNYEGITRKIGSFVYSVQ